MFKYQKVLLLFGFILAVSCGQKVESQNSKKGYAPEAVKATFQAKYPGENDPDWHVDSNGNYESRFRIDGIRHRADFNPNGAWIETEVSIEKDELPKAVRKAIDKDYSHEKITEIERVQSAEKGLFYDVEFKRKGKNKDVEFNEAGEKIN
ncbi:PepSY-like domain-containing protein [uncultured Dokdonia sp.]|uniref:PepSY-like domain-containing protein n=1 Tax=Dokdonia sp. Asnod2-E02 TaxID=3160574 RepID=UPI00263271C4|nr:PepSY-like domain-containing protein [uncultured Dokdonia sp.]